MVRRRISTEPGRAAVEQWVRDYDSAQQPREHEGGGVGAEVPDRARQRRTTATAVRFLLEELAERAPGNSVEVRVPPFGVTQCVEGPAHTRGTPPNVVELSPDVWLLLATGKLSWEQAVETGEISASGTRADLSGELPLV